MDIFRRMNLLDPQVDWIFNVFVSNFNVMLGFSRKKMDLVAHHGLMVELSAILDPINEVSCSALSSSIWLIKPHLSDIVTEVYHLNDDYIT